MLPDYADARYQLTSWPLRVAAAWSPYAANTLGQACRAVNANPASLATPQLRRIRFVGETSIEPDAPQRSGFQCHGCGDHWYFAVAWPFPAGNGAVELRCPFCADLKCQKVEKDGGEASSSLRPAQCCGCDGDCTVNSGAFDDDTSEFYCGSCWNESDVPEGSYCSEEDEGEGEDQWSSREPQEWCTKCERMAEQEYGHYRDDDFVCHACLTEAFDDVEASAEADGDFVGADDDDVGYGGYDDDGGDGSVCTGCSSFCAGEFAEEGDDFFCGSCWTDYNAANAATSYDRQAAGKRRREGPPAQAQCPAERNKADVAYVAELTAVKRLGLCPFHTYFVHMRGRADGCDGRCNKSHESPGQAALADVLFSDPPVLYCCSGRDPPALAAANLARATGFSSADEYYADGLE